jgi:hypothetical protein
VLKSSRLSSASDSPTFRTRSRHGSASRYKPYRYK